jgi:hypothetical protein
MWLGYHGQRKVGIDSGCVEKGSKALTQRAKRQQKSNHYGKLIVHAATEQVRPLRARIAEATGP